MSTDRKTTRNRSYAKVILDGSLPAYIRDLSPGGFRVYSPVPLPYGEGSVIQCRIIPSDQEDQPFDLTGQIRWDRQESGGDDIMGVQIDSYPDSRSKEQFIRLNELFSQN